VAKEALKDRASKRQNGKSTTGADLPVDSNGNLIHPLIDTHRKDHASEGGIYSEENTDVMLPTEHRDLHGNKPWLDDPELIILRAIMEDYRTCMKLRMKINNHMLAVERDMDEISPEIEAMFSKTLEIVIDQEMAFRKLIKKQLRKVDHPIVDIVQDIKGVGPISTAEIVTLVNIEKARYASSLCAFVGYAGNSKDRYVKGQKGGGHKHLRTVLFNMGSSLMRAGNEDYTDVYYRRKARTEKSLKTVMHKATKSSEWKETAWKDVNLGRRHMDSLRVMIKHFLGDLWFVWRTLEGLDTPDPYVKAVLGHERMVSPSERGWPETEAIVDLRRGNGRAS